VSEWQRQALYCLIVLDILAVIAVGVAR